MLEKVVEKALKRLETYGFKVLKLRTPGVNGVMDRMILAPLWSPTAPVFVEIKRPGKAERALQAAMRDDWRARGCTVADACDTIEDVEALCARLLIDAVLRVPLSQRYRLPEHINEGVRWADKIVNAGLTQ